MYFTIIRHLHPVNTHGARTLKPRTCVIGMTHKEVIRDCLNFNEARPNIDKKALFPYWDETEGIYILKPSPSSRGSTRITQGDEILYDPYGMILPRDADDFWLCDYNSEYNGIIVFHESNIMTIHFNGTHWVQCEIDEHDRPYHPHNHRLYLSEKIHVFSSSHTGNGIALPMKLNMLGRRIMGIEKEEEIDENNHMITRPINE